MINNPFEVEWLKTEMTGGNVFTDYGKLNNNLYFVTCCDTLCLCDEDYGVTFTEEFYNKTNGDTLQWERKHIIKTYNIPTQSETANLILLAILKKKCEVAMGY